MRPEFASVTTYDVIAAPPSEGGAAHLAVALSNDVECVGLVGVDGEVIGIAVTALDHSLTAVLEIARILKE